MIRILRDISRGSTCEVSINRNRAPLIAKPVLQLRKERAASSPRGAVAGKALRKTSLAAMFFLMAGATLPANADDCSYKYTVKESDTLASIALEAYGISSKWTLIFYANQVQFDNKPLLDVGKELKIPCLTETASVQKEPATVETSGDDAKVVRKVEVSGVMSNIHLLTADDFRPFTDRKLPEKGMITDIVDTALTDLEKKSTSVSHKVSWVNDWSAHLDPLLSRKTFDMGFPWYRPNCEEPDTLDKPARFRCDTFFFSKPVFEILVLFFTGKNSEFKFDSEADVIGKRLCRPAGYFTFDLDQNGRNWIKGEKVTLLRPKSVEECFRLLERKEVDAVALNEFTGREAVISMGIKDKIRMIEQPVSLLSLHVVVAKTHPRARTYLHYVNSSLSRLRATGAYNRIVDRHLSAFWGKQASK